MNSKPTEWNELWERLKKEYEQAGGSPEGYTDIYTPARDAYLSKRLKDYPEARFESFTMSFVINSTRKNSKL